MQPADARRDGRSGFGTAFAGPFGPSDALLAATIAAAPAIQAATVQIGSEPETWPYGLDVASFRGGPGTYPQDVAARADGYLP
jgi:hypothetical protein